MTDLNDGKPYHIAHGKYGVPDIWPDAKDGVRVKIHNGRTIKEFVFDGKHWHLRSTAYVRG